MLQVAGRLFDAQDQVREVGVEAGNQLLHLGGAGQAGLAGFFVLGAERAATQGDVLEDAQGFDDLTQFVAAHQDAGFDGHVGLGQAARRFGDPGDRFRGRAADQHAQAAGAGGGDQRDDTEQQALTVGRLDAFGGQGFRLGLGARQDLVGDGVGVLFGSRIGPEEGDGGVEIDFQHRRDELDRTVLGVDFLDQSVIALLVVGVGHRGGARLDLTFQRRQVI